MTELGAVSRASHTSPSPRFSPQVGQAFHAGCTGALQCGQIPAVGDDGTGGGAIRGIRGDASPARAAGPGSGLGAGVEGADAGRAAGGAAGGAVGGAGEGA